MPFLKKPPSKSKAKKNSRFRIAILGGAGYVGLITSVGFAELGHSVTAVDLDKGRVTDLKKGRSPLYEEGLADLIKRQLRRGRLVFTTDYRKAIPGTDIVIVAVGTPSRRDGSANLEAIVRAAESVARYLKPYTVIAVKSTVPLGTVELVRDIIARQHKPERDFDLAAIPEFLREGKAVYDFFHPDRIVIGTNTAKARRILTKLHQPLLGGSDPPKPVVHTTLQAAQLIKHAANAFLANRLTFINEIASLCDRLNVPVDDVLEGLGHDSRIGPRYLKPGPGFGGPCLEKDLTSLIALAQYHGYHASFLKAMLERNRGQIDELLSKVRSLAGYPLHGKKIALLGLTFKAGTNDMRNSPPLELAQRLIKEGAAITAFDPQADEQAAEVLPGLDLKNSPYAAARHAQLLIIGTEWPEFRELDWKKIKTAMGKPVILDARNLLNREKMEGIGFRYTGLGRS